VRWRHARPGARVDECPPVARPRLPTFRWTDPSLTPRGRPDQTRPSDGAAGGHRRGV